MHFFFQGHSLWPDSSCGGREGERREGWKEGGEERRGRERREEGREERKEGERREVGVKVEGRRE